MIWLALKGIFGRGHVLVILELDENGMPYVRTGKRNREFVKDWLNRVDNPLGHR